MTTEAALTPDVYQPNRKEDGEYYDNLSFKIPQGGLTCGCSSRTTVFKKPGKLKAHCNRVCHKKWLEKLREDDKDVFKNNILLKEVNKQQIIQINEIHILKDRVIKQNLDLLEQLELSKKENEVLINENNSLRTSGNINLLDGSLD